MMVCPKCGSMLRPKADKGKKVMACSCGHVAKEGESMLKESIHPTRKDVDVVDEEKDVLPLTEARCQKCGHGYAYYWLLQTRGGDEPETRFLKCEKCKYVWREYS